MFITNIRNTEQVGSTDNDSNLYSGGIRFESRPGNVLPHDDFLWFSEVHVGGFRDIYDLPRLLQFTSLPIHYSLAILQFAAIKSELLSASLN